MKQITNLTSNARQNVAVALEDGSIVTINLTYGGAVERWFADVSYKDKSIQGLMLSVHPNLLRSWRRVLPFGLAINAEDGVDPFQESDFEDQRAAIYFLTADDVAAVETEIVGRPA